jgi:hypothetical protein
MQACFVIHKKRGGACVEDTSKIDVCVCITAKTLCPQHIHIHIYIHTHTTGWLHTHTHTTYTQQTHTHTAERGGSAERGFGEGCQVRCKKKNSTISLFHWALFVGAENEGVGPDAGAQKCVKWFGWF